MAIKCYKKSEEFQKNYQNPDLYYNRAMVNVYIENLVDAYTDFETAGKIDVSLKGTEKAENIKEFIKTYAKNIRNKCNIKASKLNSIISSIPFNLNKGVEKKLMSVNMLKEGENKLAILSAKIIKRIERQFEVPLSFLAVDHEGNFFCLSVFNVGQELLETVQYGVSNATVIDPFLKVQVLKEDDRDHVLLIVQATNLGQFMLEGKFVSSFKSKNILTSTFFN